MPKLTKLRYAEFDTIRGHTFYGGCITQDSIIVDAGANNMEFATAIYEKYQARVFAVEPNPNLLDLSNDKITLIRSALAAKDGQVDLYLSPNIEASSIYRLPLTEEMRLTVPAISLETLLRTRTGTRISLLKLDIEGAEFEIIMNANAEILAGIEQLTIEYHDFLPRFKNSSIFKNAAARLESLGFCPIKCSVRSHGDMLYLNSSIFQIRRHSRLVLSALVPMLRKVSESLGGATSFAHAPRRPDARDGA